jgi:hypothetical protein
VSSQSKTINGQQLQDLVASAIQLTTLLPQTPHEHHLVHLQGILNIAHTHRQHVVDLALPDPKLQIGHIVDPFIKVLTNLVEGVDL